ncbi:enoyl-CoA hydratase-related protein [Sphingopyxis sp. Q841]|uniref:enoyl-CoA hydratase-related protein n=1 Tax=Sphingopyxis sp. Q841 TaxID=3458250 RepID=UPI004036E787
MSQVIVNRSVMPGWGLSQKLSRAIGLGRAKQLSLSGNFLGAEDALAWGLVNQVFKPAELLSAAVDLGKDIASADQPTVRRYRQLIDDGYMLPLGEGLNLESEWAARANRNVKAMDIARQRTEVTERGRMQS